MCFILLTACGGGEHGGLVNTSGQHDIIPVIDQPALPDALLPAFPDEQFEREHPAQVSVLDNIQLGSQVFIPAEVGASINGTALELDGNAGSTAMWGMWRWSNFQNNFPVKLLIDFEIDSGGQFYVLRTNYGTGRWEVVGPLPDTFANDGRTTYPGGNYISPGNNTYVAILTTAGTSMTINEVNLLSDDDLTPPSIPQNLVATDVQPGSITLDWDDVADLTLDGYNVYSGPDGSFQIGEPGVTQLNLFPVASSNFLASGLTPNRTYFLAVSSVDVVGNESGLSEILEETTSNDDPPGIPTGLSVDTIGSTTVNLSWTAPGDPDIQGYNVYVGDTLDFDIASGTKQEGGLFPGTSALREGLDPVTEYYARVTAVDVFNSEGLPSASVNFTTVADASPQPAFSFSPSFLQKDVESTFNPSATFDPDTDIGELTFEWDFDEDDIVDETTLGPTNVKWTFDAIGMANVSLTVSDAASSVELIEPLFINRRYQRFNLGNGSGNVGTMLDVATHPESGRVAIAYRDDNNAITLRYFNGSIWSIISMPDESFLDLTVTPQGPAALYASSGTDINWNVQRYSGTWTTVMSKTITGITEPFLGAGYLCGADNGRYSVGLVYYPKPPQFGTAAYSFHVWHEKSDTSLNDVNIFGTTRSPTQLTVNGITRTDSTTYVLDNLGTGTAVDLFTITDASSSEQSAIQTINGTPGKMYIDTDPDNPGQVFWGMLTSTDRIYYGDNYGTANGASQFVDASSAVGELLGIGLVGDNHALAYWNNRYASGHEELMGYSTSTSTQHMIGSGLGFSNHGFGGYFDNGVDTGVWVAVEEKRDGQVIARFLSDDTVQDTLVVHEPQLSSGIFTKAAPVVFSDDSIYSLHSQGYPVAMAGIIPAGHGSSVSDFFGKDSYVIPHAACAGILPNEYMVASQTTDGSLVVNSLLKGQALATQSLLIDSAGLMNMVYNPVSQVTMLVYANSGNTLLFYQTWDGVSWSGESSLAAPGSAIARLDLAARSDGEFGAIFATSGNSLRFAETSGGVWGADTEIYSGALNNVTSFISLAYGSTDQAAVAVQRNAAGIWLGLIPDGGSVSWEEVDALPGQIAFSLDVAFSSSLNPTIVYLRGTGALNDSDLFTNEKIDGIWTAMPTASVVKLIGIPLGVTRDSLGNIIVSGADKSSTPKGICVVFYD
jgi:hypothetical protein